MTSLQFSLGKVNDQFLESISASIYYSQIHERFKGFFLSMNIKSNILVIDMFTHKTVSEIFNVSLIGAKRSGAFCESYKLHV